MKTTTLSPSSPNSFSPSLTVSYSLSLSNPTTIKQPNKLSISSEDSPTSLPSISVVISVATSIIFFSKSLLTSLKLSHLRTMPANGLIDFSRNINKTLTSFTCSYTDYLRTTHMFLITDCFPNLQLLDLNTCRDISTLGIYYVLQRCLNITHLNLAGCSGVKIHRMMNFQNIKLEVLNLSYSTADDRALIAISNSCRGILQLFLKYCPYVTPQGVNPLLQNCTQLREINLNGVKHNPIHFDVDSMVLLRPSLEKITLPRGVGCVGFDSLIHLS